MVAMIAWFMIIFGVSLSNFNEDKLKAKCSFKAAYAKKVVVGYSSFGM